MDTLGMTRVFQDVLHYTFSDPDIHATFVDHSWERLTRVRRDIYRELVLEFYSTYRFAADADGHDTDGAVSFRLGGTYFSMTLLLFARHLGLFTVEELEDSGLILEDYLATCIRAPPSDFDYDDAWSLLCPDRFSASRSVERHISDPLYRLLHRVVACSLSPRKEGQEKVSRKDVFILRSFIEEGQRLDLPWHLAKVFQEIISQTDHHPLHLGFLITQLAHSLGLLTPELRDSLTIITPPMGLIDGPHMRRMRVAHISGRQTVWGEAPVEAVPEQQIPPEDQEIPDADAAADFDAEAPRIGSWEQVFSDRLDRLEDASRRRDYEECQRRHWQDWMQATLFGFVSAQASGSGPYIPIPYQPLPDMGPGDRFPPGYQSWEDWYGRDR